jgi:hypothetical protein
MASKYVFENNEARQGNLSQLSVEFLYKNLPLAVSKVRHRIAFALLSLFPHFSQPFL